MQRNLNNHLSIFFYFNDGIFFTMSLKRWQITGSWLIYIIKISFKGLMMSLYAVKEDTSTIR